MIINDIKEGFLDAQKGLNEFIADEGNFSAIYAAGDAMSNSIKNGGKIISCGTGGSM